MPTSKKKKAAYTESHKGHTTRSRSTSASDVDVVFTPDTHLGETKSKGSTASHSTGSSRRTVSVKEVMTPRVVAVTSVTFLPEAAQIMLEEDVGALPVVQEDGKLTGIITDRDITVRAVAEGRNIQNTQVAEIFTAEDLVTVTPELKLNEAEELMAEHQVRRLPVVDTDNKIVGMISLGDISRVAGERKSAEVLSEISKPGGEHDQSKEGGVQ